MAIGSRGKEARSKRCLCWRIDIESIGCLRPGYWSDKRKSCENLIIKILIIIGAGILGCAISFPFFIFAAPSARIGAGLVGALLGMMCGAMISISIFVDEDDEDDRRNANGPWWSRGNQDEYREFMEWKRKRRKKRRKKRTDDSIV